jgi:hypothetical protein
VIPCSFRRPNQPALMGGLLSDLGRLTTTVLYSTTPQMYFFYTTPPFSRCFIACRPSIAPKNLFYCLTIFQVHARMKSVMNRRAGLGKVSAAWRATSLQSSSLAPRRGETEGSQKFVNKVLDRTEESGKLKTVGVAGAVFRFVFSRHYLNPQPLIAELIDFPIEL